MSQTIVEVFSILKWHSVLEKNPVTKLGMSLEDCPSERKRQKDYGCEEEGGGRTGEMQLILNLEILRSSRRS